MREILGGLADIDPRKWRKPRLDEEAEVIYRAEQMEKSLKEFQATSPSFWKYCQNSINWKHVQIKTNKL